MPDGPTEVETLVVTGQRRSTPQQVFPVHSYPLPSGLETGDAQIGDADGLGSICDDPVLREEWDRDAAAAAAKSAFEAAAAGRNEQLGHREQTSVLHSSGGGMAIGPIGTGALGTGAASYDFTDINMADVGGLIHNHPGGSQRPSAADWAVFDQLKIDVATAGGNPSALRIYIVAPTYTAGNPNPQWRIFVYDDRNRSGGETGPEVNPDGTPC
ncbi:MAG: hypothetical protein Q8J89_11055 [Caulobacter sp.]|nr:hypothetical protein [Caulobacter sp.]